MKPEVTSGRDSLVLIRASYLNSEAQEVVCIAGLYLAATLDPAFSPDSQVLLLCLAPGQGQRQPLHIVRAEVG